MDPRDGSVSFGLVKHQHDTSITFPAVALSFAVPPWLYRCSPSGCPFPTFSGYRMTIAPLWGKTNPSSVFTNPELLAHSVHPFTAAENLSWYPLCFQCRCWVRVTMLGQKNKRTKERKRGQEKKNLRQNLQGFISLLWFHWALIMLCSRFLLSV